METFDKGLFDWCMGRSSCSSPVTKEFYALAYLWYFVQVDFYISRDLDSHLNRREVAAVEEWTESGKAFHFMRDHPHHTPTILGGAWGTRLTDPEVRDKWKKTWTTKIEEPIVWSPRSDVGSDQVFLHRLPYPQSLNIQ